MPDWTRGYAPPNRFLTNRPTFSTNRMGGRDQPVIVRPAPSSLVDRWIRDVDRRWERAIGGTRRSGG